MANWRLLDHNPFSGMNTWHGFDEETQQTLIRYEGDASGVLDVCKEESNHIDKRAEMKNTPMIHVARVPEVTQIEWFAKYGVAMWNPDHRGAVHRLLDTEYKHLKRMPIWLGNHDTGRNRSMKTVQGRRIDNIPALPFPPKLIGFD